MQLPGDEGSSRLNFEYFLFYQLSRNTDLSQCAIRCLDWNNSVKIDIIRKICQVLRVSLVNALLKRSMRWRREGEKRTLKKPGKVRIELGRMKSRDTDK